MNFQTVVFRADGILISRLLKEFYVNSNIYMHPKYFKQC